MKKKLQFNEVNIIDVVCQFYMNTSEVVVKCNLTDDFDENLG